MSKIKTIKVWLNTRLDFYPHTLWINLHNIFKRKSPNRKDAELYCGAGRRPTEFLERFLTIPGACARNVNTVFSKMDKDTAFPGFPLGTGFRASGERSSIFNTHLLLLLAGVPRLYTVPLLFTSTDHLSCRIVDVSLSFN